MAVEQPIKPYAVSIRMTQRLLGDKSRSEVYSAIGQGKLDAVKDASKTLVIVESIERYLAALPAAKIRPPAPRRPRQNNT
jgi:hypothetical protein